MLAFKSRGLDVPRAGGSQTLTFLVEVEHRWLCLYVNSATVADI